MSKSQLTRETVLQYLYDYGEIKTCNQLKLTPEELDKILNPTSDTIYIHKQNFKSVTINSAVAEIIASNYD